MSRSFALAGLLLLIAPFPAGAAEIARSYRYYTVSGDTLVELEDQLRTRGPTVANTGQRHPGATKVTFDTSVRYEHAKGRCRIAEARVRVSAIITLPRWRHSRQASEDTRFLWNTLASDIRRHEEQHADIAKRFAARLEQDLMALDSARDCTRLADGVERSKGRIFREHDREQTRFDRIEGRNFAARMERLLLYRLERMNRGGTQK